MSSANGDKRDCKIENPRTLSGRWEAPRSPQDREKQRDKPGILSTSSKPPPVFAATRRAFQPLHQNSAIRKRAVRTSNSEPCPPKLLRHLTLASLDRQWKCSETSTAYSEKIVNCALMQGGILVLDFPAIPRRTDFVLLLIRE
jgi:hypothetical protein